MRRSDQEFLQGTVTNPARRPVAQNVAANIQVTNIARLVDHSTAWHLACTVLPARLLSHRQGKVSPVTRRRDKR